MEYKIIEKDGKYELIEIIDNIKFNRGVFDSIEELEDFIKEENKKIEKEINKRAYNFWASLKKEK